MDASGDIPYIRKKTKVGRDPCDLGDEVQCHFCCCALYRPSPSFLKLIGDSKAAVRKKNIFLDKLDDGRLVISFEVRFCWDLELICPPHRDLKQRNI